MIALSGCRVSHPPDFDDRVEFVWGPPAVRNFPARVSEGLGICLKRGRAHAVKSDGRSLTFPDDAVCIRFPGCVWSSEAAAVGFVSIDVSPQALPIDLTGRRMQFVAASRLPGIAALAMHLDSPSDRFSRQEALVRVVTELLPLASERVVLRTPVARAREFLETCAAQDVALDDVAAAAECDKFALIRSFKRELGITPYSYALRLRVKRAQQLLVQGYRPAQVATATGFCDQAHFTRHFKRTVGVPPARYARQARALVAVNFVQDLWDRA